MPALDEPSSADMFGGRSSRTRIAGTQTLGCHQAN